jgi:hypothetical protein
MVVSHFVRFHVKPALPLQQLKQGLTRLVNVSFIKSVSPILNLDLIENGNILGSELDKEQDKGNEYSKGIENENKKNNKLDSKFKLKKKV